MRELDSISEYQDAKKYNTENINQNEFIWNIINTYDEYIYLLAKELEETVVIANAHGWKSTRYTKGKELRNKIAELKKLV